MGCLYAYIDWYWNAAHAENRIVGVDMLSMTPLYMSWELSHRRRDVTQRLQTELDEVMPAAGVISDAAVLNLNTFANECMYLHHFLAHALMPSQPSSCPAWHRQSLSASCPRPRRPRARAHPRPRQR